MFLKIDNWLFDKVFQPVADWFCDRSGRNPFWLAATCMYLYIAGTIIDQIMFKHSWFENTFTGFFCVFLGYTAFSYDRKSIAPRTKSGTMNPNRVSGLHFFLRVYCALTLPQEGVPIFIPHLGKSETYYDELTLFRSIMFLLFLYFEACEKKPPAPPKEQERFTAATVTT